MPKEHQIRYGWLQAMYIYTIIGAGGFGLGIIVMPTIMRNIFSWPAQDPIVYGITGSVYLSFGLLSILGLKEPLKYVPILLLQLCYKVVWFIGVIAPPSFYRKVSVLCHTPRRCLSVVYYWGSNSDSVLICV